LTGHGIGHRFWYGLGLRRHRHFATVCSDPLPQSEWLAPRLVGLPFFDDLSDTIVKDIISHVADATR
jgi:hypothetical protein